MSFIRTFYTIENSEGREGGNWDFQYLTQGSAGDALAEAMGWDSLVVSESFTSGEHTSAVLAYETAEDRDADAEGTGARAPRITKTSTTIRSIDVTIQDDLGCDVTPEQRDAYCASIATSLRLRYAGARIACSWGGLQERIEISCSLSDDFELREEIKELIQEVWGECCANGFEGCDD